MKRPRIKTCALLAWLISAPLAICALPARANEADPQPADKASEPAAPAKGDDKAEGKRDGDLALHQQQVAEKFRELEKLLLRMAELTAPSDPRRAALLRQAVAQSKDRDIEQQFDKLVELLKQDRLAVVVKGQSGVQQDLAKLLELLLSEDRGKRIEREKERVREYLKRVNRIIKEQKGIQAETDRGGQERKLAEQQGELADKAGELAEDLGDGAPQKSADKENADKQDGDKKQGDEKQGDGGDDSKKQPGDKSKDDKPKDRDADGKKKSAGKEESERQKPDQLPEDHPDGDKKDGDNKNDDAEPGDAQQKESQGKPQESPDGKKSDDSQPDGKPGKPKKGDQKEPSDGEQPPGSDVAPPEEPSAQEESPAKKRLDQARQRMKEAQQKLEQAKREEATEKQTEALKELEQAKADLEEILRQLREEEMARTLAMLESRFRKMLDQQVEVYEGTKRLDQVAEADRDRDDEIEAGRLSGKERQIALEADKALELLHEEGSAVAFPEAVAEMRDDMQSIADRLSQAKVGEVTQGVERDVIAALEEMVAALKKAQKDLDNKDKPSEANQNGGGDDQPPLVDTLSELKMIRALQMRVNQRTQRYAAMTKTEQTDTPELLDALKKLAERERRIHKVTRDIVVGRNQ